MASRSLGLPLLQFKDALHNLLLFNKEGPHDPAAQAQAFSKDCSKRSSLKQVLLVLPQAAASPLLCLYCAQSHMPALRMSSLLQDAALHMHHAHCPQECTLTIFRPASRTTLRGIHVLVPLA